MQTNKILNIREAKKTDIVALAKLSGELGYPTTTEEMESRFDKLFSNSDNCIYIAEYDYIVGWIHGTVIQSLESNPFVEIYGLVVAGTKRGTGIGTRLVAIVESWAQEKGYNQIRVRTNILREETRRFYKQVGFQYKKTQEVLDKIIYIGGLTRGCSRPALRNPDCSKNKGEQFCSAGAGFGQGSNGEH